MPRSLAAARATANALYVGSRLDKLERKTGKDNAGHVTTNSGVPPAVPSQEAIHESVLYSVFCQLLCPRMLQRERQHRAPCRWQSEPAYVQGRKNNAGRAVSSRGVVSLCVHGEIQAVNQVAPLPSATATPRQVVARATATRFTSAAVLTSSSAGPARTTPDAPSLAVASLLAALTVGRKSPISSTLRAPGESDSKHACVGSGLANLECDADKKNAWTRRHKR